jgi:hypothetical protein
MRGLGERCRERQRPRQRQRQRERERERERESESGPPYLRETEAETETERGGGRRFVEPELGMGISELERCVRLTQVISASSSSPRLYEVIRAISAGYTSSVRLTQVIRAASSVRLTQVVSAASSSPPRLFAYTHTPVLVCHGLPHTGSLGIDEGRLGPCYGAIRGDHAMARSSPRLHACTHSDHEERAPHLAYKRAHPHPFTRSGMPGRLSGPGWGR